MNYRLTSSDIVIDRVMTVMRLSSMDWIMDGFEWMGDGIQAIGTSAPLVKTAKDLTVESHRAKLPCDLAALFFVEYQGRQLKLGGDFTGYGLVDKERTTQIYTTRTSSEGGLVYYDGTPAEYESSLILNDNDYYLLNPDYLQTSFEAGKVRIHYAGYPLDKNQYPLIPDDFYYRKALEWYLISQLLLSGYKHSEINWQIADQKWEEFLPRAQNSMKFPDIGRMDRFKNMWTRLIPPESLPSDFFAGAESKDRIAGI